MKLGTRKWNTWKFDDTSSFWYDYSKSPVVLERKQHHYYATNMFVWRTSKDLLELMSFFISYADRHRDDPSPAAARFSVWKINKPYDTKYRIEFYEPIVKEKELIGTWCTKEYDAWINMKGENVIADKAAEGKPKLTG